MQKQQSGGDFYTAVEYYDYDNNLPYNSDTPDNIEQSSVADYFFFDDEDVSSPCFLSDGAPQI